MSSRGKPITALAVKKVVGIENHEKEMNQLFLAQDMNAIEWHTIGINVELH